MFCLFKEIAISVPPGSTNNSGCNSLFSSLGVAGLTSIVESKSMNLVTGGLGALEFIGKKTMDVISDGDRGLRHKRQLLSGKGESLSQVKYKMNDKVIFYLNKRYHVLIPNS